MTALARMTSEERAVHMAKVRGRDTQPEMYVREFLDRAGAVYDAHPEDLPGTPDVVSRDQKVAIFVHGCFRHRKGCRREKSKESRDYWEKKFAASVASDERAVHQLRGMDWRVIIVWECEARKKKIRARLLSVFAPHRRVCHDCAAIAIEGYAHCSDCRDRMAGKLSTRDRRRDSDVRPRARRAALGLCTTCGLPAVTDTKSCPKHAKRHSVSNTSTWVNGLRDKGLCRCHAPLAPGRARCAACLLKLRDEATARYARYKAEGRCQFCIKKRLRGSTWCADHRARVYARQPVYAKKHIEKRINENRCVICGEPAKPDKQTCTACTDRMRLRWQERVANGLCGRCGDVVTPGYKTCARCRKKYPGKERKHA